MIEENLRYNSQYYRGGNVIHTFTIEETGSYEIFIESSATVHITGAITIK